ncbi:hypothetical protein GCM10028796_12740 [Ramlibacter monticola]|uniref:Uncharacterized protein n=1 Tax=Ramlibacter monticola TaxID=1926872 RepID=A0A937CS69_9BURK|nr:hypothetical protein [Ramlibacter monticola]MBL0390123.1 hypothetical protein [Ramlibacter monticola]
MNDLSEEDGSRRDYFYGCCAHAALLLLAFWWVPSSWGLQILYWGWLCWYFGRWRQFVTRARWGWLLLSGCGVLWVVALPNMLFFLVLNTGGRT